MLRERRRHANYKPNRRLDRKSSRGMLYENEELRLRTININAEVERGQSDIRKLRRENELLKREIWILRGEYDDLHKLLKINKLTENDANHSGSSRSEDSDSCDTCKYDEIEEEINDIDDDDCIKTSIENNDNDQCEFGNKQEIVENYENSQKTLHQKQQQHNSSTEINQQQQQQQQQQLDNCQQNKSRDNLHVNFDHLSIVSEENLTNSDGNSVQQGDMDANNISPLTPAGLQVLDLQQKAFKTLGDIQAQVPPLSHFENIAYDDIGPSLASLEDVNCSTSTTTTGETVIPANGWDFNIKSPFSSFQAESCITTAGSAAAALSQTTTTNSHGYLPKSPKHFFSPIKPRITIQDQIVVQQINNSNNNNNPLIPMTKGPDVFVSNALASPYQRSNYTQPQTTSLVPLGGGAVQRPIEQMYATVQKNARGSSPHSFQSGGNLEDLLSDIQTLSNDILQMQLEKQKSYSQEKLNKDDSISNRKPYRSEMNLVLTYNGSNPVITPISRATSTSSATAIGIAGQNHFSIDTPPPNMPEPMILFPQNLTYLGFENFGQSCGGGSGTTVGVVPAVGQLHGQNQLIDHQYPAATLTTYSNDYATVHVPSSTVCDIPAPPPISISSGADRDSPDVESSPAVIRRKRIPIATRSDDLLLSGSSCTATSMAFDNSNSGGTVAAVAVSGSSPVTVALSPAPPPLPDKFSRAESSTSENANCDSSSGSEATKRKSRRVSILPTNKNTDDIKSHDKDNQDIIGNKPLIATPGSSASNLTVPTSDILHPRKSMTPIPPPSSHSTPNSPHSGGRRNSTSGHHHHNHHRHGHHHQHQNHRKLSQDSSSRISSSGQLKSRCSRRHSDGTVVAAISSTGSGGGGQGGGGPGTAGFCGSTHGIRDSYHEPGTSVSERNSNSLASSRESSTSLSMRSQRRKISVSSHNGGKIPWCGCWGNGCV